MEGVEPVTDPSALQSVQPGPVPTYFGVATAPTEDGRALIALRVDTPVGMALYFLEPGAAVQVGNALRAAGKAEVSKGPKLVTPHNGLIVPG